MSIDKKKLDRWQQLVDGEDPKPVMEIACVAIPALLDEVERLSKFEEHIDTAVDSIERFNKAVVVVEGLEAQLEEFQPRDARSGYHPTIGDRVLVWGNVTGWHPGWPNDDEPLWMIAPAAPG